MKRLRQCLIQDCDFATNGRHIVCQRPLPQVSSWISPSLRTHFCYVRHVFFNLWCVLGRPLWPALCTIRKGLVEAVASNLMLCSVRTCGWTAWMYGSLHVPHLYGRVGAAEDGPEEGHGGHGAERASSTTATPVFTASWDEDASNGKSGTASSSDT